MGSFPHYLKPPVVEVAIGVQFAPIQDISLAHIGLFWNKIKPLFPRVADQSPIGHIIESTESSCEPTKPTFQLLDKPEMPRVWFLDQLGNKIVQVQVDRFLYNWRKLKSDDMYPRFTAVREEFGNYWNQFNGFLKEQNLQSIQPDQCEVTYVNHILKGQGWETMAEAYQLFTPYTWQTRQGFLSEPEIVRWSLKFLLPDKQGRLHVELMPVWTQSTQALRLTLTARGIPTGEINDQSINQWFDLAHEWIVKGFADLVGEKTDTVWEKQS